MTMPIDKRDHIIKKAVELFAEKGFEGSSIRDLAAKADVNVAMVNYYFGSKEKLFEALVEKRALFMSQLIENVITNKSLLPIEQLDRIIEGYIIRFLADPQYHRVLQQELLITQREQMHEKIIELIAKNAFEIIQIIKRGIKSKVFNKVDPELVFASILGTISQVLMSRSLCLKIMNKPKDYDPYSDKQFHQRLTKHIQDMVHSHLLK
jgi:AcrR family transcriptional regulator